MINDYTNYVSGNDFISSNADVKTRDNSFDYNSFYRAYVISTDDPEKLGRIKVQIPALHTTGGYFPWAYPACFTGMGYQTGMFILPPIGSVVFVTFEYSDEHRPIYFGGLPSKYAPGKTQRFGNSINGGEAVEIYDDDLPTEYTGSQQIIYKSPSGNIIYFDSSDDYNAIILKNIYNQHFSIVSEVDENNNRSNYIEMKYDDENYLRINENDFQFIINGEPVPIGGGGSGTAKTVIWD